MKGGNNPMLKFKKIFSNTKTRLLAILSINIAVLSAAVVMSTLSWFVEDVSIGPVEHIPSSILTGYFDENDHPNGFSTDDYPHGCSANPYVITRPIHYYNLVRLQELGNFGFDSQTFFQFGKQFNKPANFVSNDPEDPDGSTVYPYLFYKYNDNGVEVGTSSSPVYDNYLNMKYYSGSNALSPIGSSRHPFEGTINGHNLTVKNLYIKGAGYSDVGIFGYTSESSYIHNLYFNNVHIDAANATAIAPGSVGHAAHDTHVYIGYLAGHIFNNSKFSNVYINNCSIYNTVNTEYEMINTFGFFGHTDEPMGSSEDTSGYTSQLVAANAYDAISYSSSLGGTSPLARRYTNEHSSGFSFSHSISESNNVYRIDEEDNSGTKPYSLSSIGYSSGDAGTFKYARYSHTVGEGEEQETRLETINGVEPENVLSEKPQYVTYDEYGNPDYSNANNPVYEFYGKNDGDYIYYDNSDPEDTKWVYAKVTGKTNQPVVSTVRLNCHTISYSQTVNGITKKYFLKYQEGAAGEYDTLVPVEWPSSTPPQTDEYYFCFKTSFGHNGVSRFVECSADVDYYIYSPYGQKYLCTYSPKTPSGNTVLGERFLHTPVFIPETGYAPANATGSHKWLPMKFTIGGPLSQITYLALENDDSINESTSANEQFDRNVNRSKPLVRGALQGPNATHAFGVFGGHKMIAGATGGTFTIGDYQVNQTTSLNNGVNYKLTSESTEIVENSTLVIAGFQGEQTSTYSIDYAMGSQMQNNRDVKVIKEVRDSSGYVLNDTTGVAKLVVNYVGYDEDDNNEPIFTLLSTDGYLCFPAKGVFPDTSQQGNWLRSYDYETLHEPGHTNRIEYSKWKYVRLKESGKYTRYRFQNMGDPNRYLTYNINTGIFATYDITVNPLNDNNIVVPYDPDHPEYNSANYTCWFYIYKQQHGQTIQDVHYTIGRIIEVPGAVTYPYKDVEKHDLLVSDIDNSPTDPENYTVFRIDPSFNVYFNTTTSQVQYFEAYVRVWKRVNLVSELNEGDTVMIGARTGSGNGAVQHYFMGSQASNYRNRSSSVSFKPPYVQADDIPTNAATFSLTRSDRGWRFDTGSGFLYAAGGSSSNYLRTETQPDSNGNADWSITILTDGTANITSQGRNVTRNKMCYYSSQSWWSSSAYFSCFSSVQTKIQLYKLAQSSADRSTYVGDLINNFEPFRMDAVGPNIEYHTDYMKMNQNPQPINNNGINNYHAVGSYFYPSVLFKNAITLLIDANGSSDLGTLKFECRYSNSTDMPYFYLPDGSRRTLSQENAVDKDANNSDNVHSFLLNITSRNIAGLTYHYIEGEGFYSPDYKDGQNYFGKEFKICESNSENLTKYLVVLAAPSGCEITNITFTFNATPGNIGYPGPVDYRTADYDSNGFFTGTYLGFSSTTEESSIGIYYDMIEIGQQLSISVQFDHSTGTYIISIDTTNSVLTVDLIINVFKYDNNATQLSVLVDGVPVEYDGAGSLSVTIPANASPGP